MRLNHTSVFKAILLYCGISEEKHLECHSILKKSQVCGKIHAHFIVFCVNDASVGSVHVCLLLNVHFMRYIIIHAL